MNNYIRANFCTRNRISDSQSYRLLTILDTLECRYNIWRSGEILGYEAQTNRNFAIRDTMTEPHEGKTNLVSIADLLSSLDSARIAFGWKVGSASYSADLLKDFRYNQSTGRFVLAMEEKAFLSPSSPVFEPRFQARQNSTFIKYKEILSALIRTVRPFIGTIDYESDLSCDEFDQYGGIASWGNFVAFSLLRRLSNEDQQLLYTGVDDFVMIDDIGVLTFIHPLLYPYDINSRTLRHKRLDAWFREMVSSTN